MKATRVFFTTCDIFFPAQLFNIHFLSNKFVYIKSLDFILQCISIHMFCPSLLLEHFTFLFCHIIFISNFVFSLDTTCFHHSLFLHHPDLQNQFSCQGSFHILLPSSKNSRVLSTLSTIFASWLWVQQCCIIFLFFFSRASLILYFKYSILLVPCPTLFQSEILILPSQPVFLSFFYFSLFSFFPFSVHPKF